MAQQGSYIQPSFVAPRYPEPYGAPAPSHAPPPFPQQQNVYPSAATPSFVKPHPSPDPYTQPRQGQHVPNQHYPAAGRSSLMLPPSSLPEDINKRRHPPPQGSNNLWPRELPEEQRQVQDGYAQHATPINPFYAQRPPSTKPTSIAPVSSSAPVPGLQSSYHPYQQTQTPISTSHPTPTMTAANPPPAAPTSTAQPSPMLEASTSEPVPPHSTKSVSAQSPNSQPPPSNNLQAQQTAVSNAAAPAPQPPSPFEAQRVSALLEINRFLLLELSSLVTKPTSPSETAPGDPTKTPQSRPNPQSSPHYVDYMRRLQSNLAYLASVADRPHKPQNSIPPWPAIMDPPARKGAEVQGGGEESEVEKGVRERYEGLKELWPEWKGKDASLMKSGS